MVVLLVVGTAVVVTFLLTVISREGFRGAFSWLISQVGNVITILLAIAMGTISTSHICLHVLSNHSSLDSAWNTVYEAFQILTTRDSPNSEWNTAFSASVATSLAWSIVSYEKWELRALHWLSMGTSVGTNVGVVAGLTDVLKAAGIAFCAAVITSLSLHILDRTLHLFMNWITEKVINTIRGYIVDFFREEVRRGRKRLESFARSGYAYLMGEETELIDEQTSDNDLPGTDVVTSVAITWATFLGGFVGYGDFVQHVPYLNIEQGFNDLLLPSLISAVSASTTMIGMRVPLVFKWTSFRFLVGVLFGVSLGTNIGIYKERKQIGLVVFVATSASLAATIFLLLLRIKIRK